MPNPQVLVMILKMMVFHYDNESNSNQIGLIQKQKTLSLH
jgi:hypothetical protein